MTIFGSAILTAFGVQVVTGIALASKYAAAPAHAYDTVQHLTNEVWLGWLVRGMHFYGASAMIVLVLVHMARVFLTGSYKYPRQMNWVTGVLLLGLTFGMGFTGQLLRWDQDGLWTVMIASQFVERVPFIGSALAEVVLAGDDVSGTTLSRFFVLHVVVFPALIGAFVAVHLYLVIRHGISEPPVAGRPVDPSSYEREYAQLERAGGRFWPDAAWRDAVVGLLVILVVITLAVVLGPRPLNLPPDPTQLDADPRPDWYLRWYYALLYLHPRTLGDWVMVWAPILVGLYLLALPFVFARGERHPRRRPWAVASVLIVTVGFGYLTWLGVEAPWVPRFTTEPIDPARVGLPAGPATAGAHLFYERGCQYCHAVHGFGGVYGPDLTDVSARMSDGQLVAIVTQGFGDMPAYRETLPPGELDALLAFFRAAAALEPGRAP